MTARRTHRPLWVGLTGGIGSGKSLVLSILRKKRVPVLQTDRVGHQLLEKDAIRRKLVRTFGKDILDSHGKVSRIQLGGKIFKNPALQKKLNELLHPAIRREVARWARSRAALESRSPFIVVEVPLLFERGFNRWFDRTLSISASDKIRRKRLLKRGWSLSEIRRRQKLQWPQARKDRAADGVIFNQTTPKDLEYAVKDWMGKLAGPTR